MMTVHWCRNMQQIRIKCMHIVDAVRLVGTEKASDSAVLPNVWSSSFAIWF
jgi:hypothetical protein